LLCQRRERGDTKCAKKNFGFSGWRPAAANRPHRWSPAPIGWPRPESWSPVGPAADAGSNDSATDRSAARAKKLNASRQTVYFGDDQRLDVVSLYQRKYAAEPRRFIDFAESPLASITSSNSAPWTAASAQSKDDGLGRREPPFSTHS